MWMINNDELKKAWDTSNFTHLRDWWKLPVLQGEENDYGDYDYLIEDIPNDNHNWINYYCKCEDCGKYHHINYRQYHYFRTMDGYDEMDYTQCLFCYIKGVIHYRKKMFKQWFETRRWKFFADTRLGKKLTKIGTNLHNKYPNKLTAKLFMFTLPF